MLALHRSYTVISGFLCSPYAIVERTPPCPPLARRGGKIGESHPLTPPLAKAVSSGSCRPEECCRKSNLMHGLRSIFTRYIGAPSHMQNPSLVGPLVPLVNMGILDTTRERQ